MDEQPPNYRAEFLRSPHHAALGLLTLGIGFLSAHLIELIAGATLYALGWVHLPDMGFFRRWVDRRAEARRRAEELQRIAEFAHRRDGLLNSISSKRRARYEILAEVCRDIETAGAENPLATADAGNDPRLRRLDELMWTYLRLLGIEESLERFLETERNENLPEMLKQAEAEADRLKKEADALKAKGDGIALDSKQRYLGSRLERLEVLRRRQQRVEQGEENLALVASEQDRLDQQIKLIRADAVATKNSAALTARIDATVEHLDQTNKWLSELDEFKDLVGDLPATEQRVGYETGRTAPPVIGSSQAQARPAVRQKERA